MKRLLNAHCTVIHDAADYDHYNLDLDLKYDLNFVSLRLRIITCIIIIIHFYNTCSLSSLSYLNLNWNFNFLWSLFFLLQIQQFVAVTELRTYLQCLTIAKLAKLNEIAIRDRNYLELLAFFPFTQVNQILINNFNHTYLASQIHLIIRKHLVFHCEELLWCCFLLSCWLPFHFIIFKLC